MEFMLHAINFVRMPFDFIILTLANVLLSSVICLSGWVYLSFFLFARPTATTWDSLTVASYLDHFLYLLILLSVVLSFLLRYSFHSFCHDHGQFVVSKTFPYFKIIFAVFSMSTGYASLFISHFHRFPEKQRKMLERTKNKFYSFKTVHKTSFLSLGILIF